MIAVVVADKRPISVGIPAIVSVAGSTVYVGHHRVEVGPVNNVFVNIKLYILNLNVVLGLLHHHTIRYSYSMGYFKI